MANVDSAFGFLPTPLLRSRPYTSGGGSTATFIGDVMGADGNGDVDPTAGSDIEIIGSSLTYLAASGTGTQVIADHPDQEVHAQDDGQGTVATTLIFGNADHIATAGSAATKMSRHELDGSTFASTAAGFRLLDLVDTPTSAVADFAIWRCVCVEHHLTTPTSVGL